MRGRTALALGVLVVESIGCDSTAPESTTTVPSPTETSASDPTTSAAPGVEVLRDESIGDITTADVYRQPEARAVPVVLMHAAPVVLATQP